MKHVEFGLKSIDTSLVFSLIGGHNMFYEFVLHTGCKVFVSELFSLVGCQVFVFKLCSHIGCQVFVSKFVSLIGCQVMFFETVSTY